MKAVWNNKILAENDETVVIEGNHYFPPDSLNKEYFLSSNTQTICPWKGTAYYYSIETDGRVNKDAAWYYPYPRPEAIQIKDYIAFNSPDASAWSFFQRYKHAW